MNLQDFLNSKAIGLPLNSEKFTFGCKMCVFCNGPVEIDRGFYGLQLPETGGLSMRKVKIKFHRISCCHICRSAIHKKIIEYKKISMMIADKAEAKMARFFNGELTVVDDIQPFIEENPHAKNKNDCFWCEAPSFQFIETTKFKLPLTDGIELDYGTVLECPECRQTMDGVDKHAYREIRTSGVDCMCSQCNELYSVTQEESKNRVNDQYLCAQCCYNQDREFQMAAMYNFSSAIKEYSSTKRYIVLKCEYCDHVTDTHSLFFDRTMNFEYQESMMFKNDGICCESCNNNGNKPVYVGRKGDSIIRAYYNGSKVEIYFNNSLVGNCHRLNLFNFLLEFYER